MKYSNVLLSLVLFSFVLYNRRSSALEVLSDDYTESKLLSLLREKRDVTHIDVSTEDLLNIGVEAAGTLLEEIPGVGPFVSIAFKIIWELFGPKYDTKEEQLKKEVMDYVKNFVQGSIAKEKANTYLGKLKDVRAQLNFYNASSVDWFMDKNSSDKRIIVRNKFGEAYGKVTGIVNVGSASDYLYAILASTTLAHQIIQTLLKDVTRFGEDWNYGSNILAQYENDRLTYSEASMSEVADAFNQYDRVAGDGNGDLTYNDLPTYPQVMVRACFLQRTLIYLRTELYPFGVPTQVADGAQLPANKKYYQIYGEYATKPYLDNVAYKNDKARHRLGENCILGRIAPYEKLCLSRGIVCFKHVFTSIYTEYQKKIISQIFTKFYSVGKSGQYFLRMYFTPLGGQSIKDITLQLALGAKDIIFHPSKEIIQPFPVKEIVPSRLSGRGVTYKYAYYDQSTEIHFYCLTPVNKTNNGTSSNSITINTGQSFRFGLDYQQNWIFRALELYRVDQNDTNTCQ
ncbi:unnamed protein product [Didymodactylos carnosus]|uniref:Uncharacterized protein n=1 Tax=Didymodactylos carnosus TaxID=1234261 RepID=A0A815WWN9_9BILA|nr:unnamed protein product [Didymodactylos carnosus]CAF1553076.1 unnamed protein product [Didymodactylos carnosus]CAF4278781.1 unnamed protein product [Didymodactylos carnosus]CAF4414191.1 unnamed protein product [Didymodactylos carnosus]